MKKRIFSLLLAGCMAVSMLSIPTRAEETPAYFCGFAQEHTHDSVECFLEDQRICEYDYEHTHSEGCLVDPNEQSLPEEPEVPAGVQAFLDAVKAIAIPEAVNEETGPVLNGQIGAASAAYDQLEAEDYSREDVIAALATLETARNALTGGETPGADTPGADTPGENTPEPHTCSEIEFTPWTEAAALPDTAGNYCLMQDVKVAGGTPVWKVPSGTVNLCLNGYKIELNGSTLNGSQGMLINSGSTLNLYNCNGSGSGKGYIHTTSGWGWTRGAHVSGGVLTMQDVTIQTCQGSDGIQIDSGSVTLNAGAKVINNPKYGIILKNGSLTINGGQITGNERHGISAEGGSLTVNSGTITGNSSSDILKGDTAAVTLSGSTVVGKMLLRTPIQLGTMTAGAQIGIAGNETDEFLLVENASQEAIQYLQAADNGSVMILRGSDIWVHRHNPQYALARVDTKYCPVGKYDTIMETCSGCNHQASMRMAGPSKTLYEGDWFQPQIKTTGNYIGKTTGFQIKVPGGAIYDYRSAKRYTVTYRFANYVPNGGDWDLTVEYSIYEVLDNYEPKVPVAAEVTDTTIRVGAVWSTGETPRPRNGVSYAISESATATEAELIWQESTTFTGLKPETTYYVYARYDAYDGGNANTPVASSVSKPSAPITTLEDTMVRPDTPAVTAGEAWITVTETNASKPGAVGALEYAISTTNKAPASGWKRADVEKNGTKYLDFTGLTPSTTYYMFARYAGDASTPAAVCITPAAVQTLAANAPVISIPAGATDYPITASVDSTGRTYQWYEVTGGQDVLLSGETQASLLCGVGTHTYVCVETTAYTTLTGKNVTLSLRSNELKVNSRPRPLTWSLSQTEFIWDGTFRLPDARLVTLQGTSASSILPGDQVGVTLSVDTVPTQPGPCTIKATLVGKDAAKYTLSNESVTVNYAAPFQLGSSYAPDKEYDGTSAALPVQSDLTLAAGVRWEDLSFRWSAKTGAALTNGNPVNAGSYTLTVSYKDYAVTKDMTIGKMGTHATVNHYVRYNDTGVQRVDLTEVVKAYGTASAYAVEAIDDTDGLLNAQSVTVSDGIVAFQLADNLTAGSIGEDAYIQIKVEDLPNHDLRITVDIELTDKLPQTNFAIANPGIITYGDTFPLNTTGGNGNGAVTFSEFNSSLLRVNQDGTFTAIGAGSTTITATKAGDDTYAEASAQLTITIGKYPLTVTAGSVTMQVNHAMPILSYTVSGYPSGMSFPPIQIAVSAPTADTTKVGTYPIELGSISWSEIDNFDVTLADGTLSVVEHLYRIIQGAGQTVFQGNVGKFTSNAPFAKFDGVYVDNQLVAPANYLRQEGSTIITLSADFIKTLSLGTHDLRIKATDGDAVTTFQVSAPTAASIWSQNYDTDSPRTGDTTQNGLWLALAAIGLLGLTATILAKKRGRKG